MNGVSVLLVNQYIIVCIYYTCVYKITFTSQCYSTYQKVFCATVNYRIYLLKDLVVRIKCR